VTVASGRRFEERQLAALAFIHTYSGAFRRLRSLAFHKRPITRGLFGWVENEEDPPAEVGLLFCRSLCEPIPQFRCNWFGRWR
jgi:hypothetical protein